MGRHELIKELQKNANEIKSITDGLNKESQHQPIATSLGNLSFLVALLQEQVEKLLREVK